MGGNPQVLLLLFCLFCVILICFVGIFLNLMRKSKREKFFCLVCQKKKNSSKKKNNPHFSESWHGRANPSTKKKTFFFLLPHSNNTTSFILQLLSLNLHNFLQTLPNHTKSYQNLTFTQTNPRQTRSIASKRKGEKFALCWY